jgi:hypothetical protein
VDPKIPIVVLKGSGKLVVVMVPLKVPDGEAPSSLIRFTGLEHKLAGVTLRADRMISNMESIAWPMLIDGDTHGAVISHHPMVKNETWMKLPGVSGSIALRADTVPAGAIDPEVLLTDYKKRLADGSLAELERFHREPHVAKRALGLKIRQAKLEEICKSPITVTMDWSTVPDEDIGETSHCYGLVAALGDVCLRDEASRREVISRVVELQCSRGESTKVTLGADKILRRSEAKKGSHRNGESYATRAAYKPLVALLKLTRTVLQAADGLTVVLDPDVEAADVYAGRDGLLYRQKAAGRSVTKREVWNGSRYAHLVRTAPGKWLANCPSQKMEFAEVDDKIRKDVLASAKLEPRIWRREALALARDDHGIYYFVDKFDPLNGGKGYRVFKGPRGALKLTRLVDIVNDSDGQIFATTKGKLRLVINKGRDMDARWIEGRKERSLTNLSLEKNRELIYGDLGVYAEDQYGSICDL